MQANILWTGREYYSLENCLVMSNTEGFEISSAIVGQYQNKLYRVQYQIKTNNNWETLFIEIKSQHSDKQTHLLFESDGKGNWKTNSGAAAAFKGCIDVDIPLTPFTNTLPINRLKLQQGDTQEISVIYFDMLEQQVTPVRQQYTCLSATQYHYENIPNDFEANIQVDALGLVVDYPSLFVRSGIAHSNYEGLIHR